MLSSKRQAPVKAAEAQPRSKKIKKIIDETEIEVEKFVKETTKSLQDQLSRAFQKIATDKQTISKLQSPLHGEAGLRLIKASSRDGAPNVTAEHLAQNGVAMTLRKELNKNLSHECEEWLAERTRHARDGTYTTSLAEDLKHYLKDVDLLASLPNGPKEAVQFLLTLGNHQTIWDEPPLVGPECVPGSPSFEEVKSFFIALDDKMGDIYGASGHDPTLFATDSSGIIAMIDRIEQDQEAELEFRSTERRIELAKTYGYHADQFNEFRDDEGFRAQDTDDMTDDEEADFEDELEIKEAAALAGEQLWESYFKNTLTTLYRIYDEMEIKEDEDDELEEGETKGPGGDDGGAQEDDKEGIDHESNALGDGAQ